VASPYLADPNFHKTVVLMLQHDEDGAFGLVLNRPTPGRLRDIWELLEGQPCDCEQPIYQGGPVEGPLMALHGDVLRCEEEVMDGVYLAMRKDNIREIVERATAPFMIFSGYSGWGNGQLEDELKHGGWLLAPASRDEVFGDASQIWSEVSNRIGFEIINDAVKPKHVPEDPRWN